MFLSKQFVVTTPEGSILIGESVIPQSIYISINQDVSITLPREAWEKICLLTADYRFSWEGDTSKSD